MRRLYLLRHGIAGPTPLGGTDQDRTLTPEGQQQLKDLARALPPMGWAVDRLLCSPYQRTLQTAAIIGPALGLEGEPVHGLASGCSLYDVLDCLSDEDLPSHVMLIGHQPYLGQLIHHLTGAVAAVPPAALAALDVHALRPGGGVLVGLYGPSTLAALGRSIRHRQGGV